MTEVGWVEKFDNLYTMRATLFFCFGQAFHFYSYTFFEDKDAVGDAESGGFGDESFDGFVEGFVS